VSPERAWKEHDGDEDFSHGGRGPGGGDSADGLAGRVRQQAHVINVIDIKLWVSHFGHDYPQLRGDFLGINTAD